MTQPARPGSPLGGPSLALAPYAVELLYASAPRLRASDLGAALAARCGSVSQTAGKEDRGPVIFSFDDFASPDELTPQLVFAPNPLEIRPSRYAEALSHTRDWDDAELATGAAHAAAYLTDFLAGGIERKRRISLFVGATAALAELTPVLAVHWIPCQKMVDPRALIAAADGDPLGAALNVRAFRVEGHLPGELFLDTLGLAALGVPDLQCRFVGLDPEHMAQHLRHVARLAWERGTLTEIPGLHGEAWRVRAAEPLSPPAREVLEIEPSLRFSARGGEA